MQLARPSALVLGLAALGACFSGGGGGASTGTGINNKAPLISHAAAAADPLGFLPADAEMVIGVDMQQVLASPLWRRFEQRFNAMLGKELAEFKATCGYDPFTTLRGVTVGVKVGTSDNPEGVFVVRGPDRDKTMACLPRAFAKEGRTLAIDGGVVTIPPKSANEHPTAMTFVDASTLVLATGPQMSRAKLDAILAAGVPLRKSRAFAELWSGIDAKQTVWAVMNGSSKVFDGFAQMGSRPKAVIGTLSLENGLAASGRVRFDSADQATQLSGTLQGQLGMIRGMVEKIEVAAEGTDLTLKLVVSIQQIEMIAGMAGLGGP